MNDLVTPIMQQHDDDDELRYTVHVKSCNSISTQLIFHLYLFVLLEWLRENNYCFYLCFITEPKCFLLLAIGLYGPRCFIDVAQWALPLILRQRRPCCFVHAHLSYLYIVWGAKESHYGWLTAATLIDQF